MDYLKTIGINAKKAFEDLKGVKHKKIKKVLENYNQSLLKNTTKIIRENLKDVKNVKRKHLVDRLILNKKIRFRTSMIDNFDKVGIINNISLHGKYNISSTISIDDIRVKDQLISVKGGDIVWSIGEITDTDVTLRHFKRGTNEILAKKSIQKNTLKNYRLLYEDVPVYNILNNDSDLEKINMIWKRVNNYKSLSNLGKEILEYISKGFLKEKI